MPNELIGLVLAGGKSRRMQKDKTQISYNGVNQTQFAYDLLDSICDHTYISCRRDQQDKTHFQLLPQIHDEFDNIGPLGGILSAQQTYPSASFLVLACDLPYLKLEVLESLVSLRDPSKIATCYENPQKHWPEPLCTIYEPHSYQLLKDSLEKDRRCPRKILASANIKRLDLSQFDGANPLDNINTPEEYLTAMQKLNSEDQYAS